MMPPSSGRGTCPECGYRFALRKDGTIMGHLLWGLRYGYQQYRCEGSGLPPRELVPADQPATQPPGVGANV